MIPPTVKLVYKEKKSNLILASFPKNEDEAETLFEYLKSNNVKHMFIISNYLQELNFFRG